MWCVVCGVWGVVCGVWCVVCGVWVCVIGVSCVVCGRVYVGMCVFRRRVGVCSRAVMTSVVVVAQEYGTRIVCFVSTVGDVHLPVDALSTSFAVTRSEVDRLGRLTILRRSSHWHRYYFRRWSVYNIGRERSLLVFCAVPLGIWHRVTVEEAGSADSAQLRKLQAALDSADDAAFCSLEGTPGERVAARVVAVWQGDRGCP